jgi:outer membrane protein OmpA-like peptidoglycan-associated protein
MSEQAITQVKPQPISTMPTASSHGILQRCSNGVECEECRKKRESSLQRAAVNATPTNSVPPIVHEVLRSPGQPLDRGTRAFMESRFGHDFSGVRIHSDERAAESARSVNALAYTVGRDLVFGIGQYSPGTMVGKRLLAHELTHVVQQGSGAVPMRSSLELGATDTWQEREAESIASRLISGASAQTTTDIGAPMQKGVVQRQENTPREEKQDKPQKSTIPTIHIPVFDEFDPSVIVPDSIPGIGGQTLKLSDVRKAVDAQFLTQKGPGICAIGMEEALLGEFKGLCCSKAPRSKDTCCTWRNVDIMQGRCCTSHEFNYQGRCIKPEPARPAIPAQTQQQSPSPQAPHLQLGTPRVRAGTIESATIDHFTVDGAQIPAVENLQLDHLAGLLKIYRDAEVHIEGHTDSTFTAEYNQPLSERRAQAVVQALRKRGVDTARFAVKGFGKTQLLYPEEKTTEEKAHNRRVEIWFYTPPAQKIGSELQVQPGTSAGTIQRQVMPSLNLSVMPVGTGTIQRQEHPNPLSDVAKGIIAKAKDEKVDIKVRAVALIKDIINSYYPSEMPKVGNVIFDDDKAGTGLQTDRAGRGASAKGTINVGNYFIQHVDHFAHRVMQVGHELQHIDQYRGGMVGGANAEKREFLAFYQEAMEPEKAGTGRLSYSTRLEIIDAALGSLNCLSSDEQASFASEKSKLLKRRDEVNGKAGNASTNPPTNCKPQANRRSKQQ